MSIWYSLDCEFRLAPDVDPAALAAASQAYAAATPARVEHTTGWLLVTSEGDMSVTTADALYAGLLDLIRRFGAPGEAAVICRRQSDDEDGLPRWSFAGPPAAVRTALAGSYLQRQAELRAAYADQLAALTSSAGAPADPDAAFVATKGW